MPFDGDNEYVRPVSFQQDKINGLAALAERFDVELDDHASALSALRQLVADLSITPVDLSLYVTLAAFNAAMAGKQATLGYTPQNAAQKGLANGYAGLGADGKVPSAQLPAQTTSGVTSFNGRSAAVSLLNADVLSALGFTPLDATAAIPQSQITGLSGALTGKQDVSGKGAANGYAPLDSSGKVPASYLTGAGVSSFHSRTGAVTLELADITTTLGYSPASYSTATAAAQTVFSLGQIVLAQTSGTIALRATSVLYADTAASVYTTTATGTALTGVWRCLGGLWPAAINAALFQRTA
jgi:hypothetical protein